MWGWGGTAGPDRLTWGGDRTFGVGVAVGTQLSIGNLTIATREFGVYSTLCHTG
jgi:hypothetical protein